MDFNAVENHLLASAGASSEIFVWDINRFGEPYAPANAQGQVLDENSIESVAWNNKVANILAAGGSNGTTAVWDTKKWNQQGRPVLKLQYAKSPVSSVVWHPTNSTTLMTASLDDTSPVICLWDLRNANAPAKVLQGHERGVLSLDWCKQDSGFLLSSGKDNRTLLWNPETGDKLGEYPTASNWSFETAFNPRSPNMFASATFDGAITVQTLQDTGGDASAQAQPKPEGEDFWNSSFVDVQKPTFKLTQAPKWLQRPVSVNFGFGGKIVRVSTQNGASSVSINNFVGDQSINEGTSKFADALQSNDLYSVAQEKVESSDAQKDKYDWEVISALLSEGTKKEKLAKFYGGVVSSDKTSSVEGANEAAEKPTETPDDESTQNKATTDGGDGDFYNELASTPEPYTPKGPFDLFSKKQSDAEKTLIKSVLQGKVEEAVNICINEDRLSDAFMLALNASDNVKEKVQNAYVSKNADSKPFVRLLASVSSKKLDDVVDNANTSEWKEIITGLFTYCDDDETFAALCGRLGDRLLEKSSAKDTDRRNSAVFCYLAGSNLQKVSSIWLREVNEAETENRQKNKSGDTPYAAHVKALHSFIEKVTVFQKAVDSLKQDKSVSGDDNLAHLYDAYRDYANIVASQGHLELAEKYLNLLPPQYPGVSIEKDRVQKAAKKDTGAKATAAATSGKRGPGSSSPAKGYNPGASIYAPAAGGTHTTVPPAQAAYGGIPPAPGPQPPQPSAPGYTPAANPYQPPAAPIPPQVTPQAAAPPPPPMAGQPAGGAPPVKGKREVGGWNDLPTATLNAANARKGGNSTQTINSPFPNQQQAYPPPPVASPPTGNSRPGSTSGQSVPPPPPPTNARPPPSKGSTPPITSPQAGSPQLASPPIANRYAPTPGAPQTQAPPPANGFTQAQPGPAAVPPPNPYAQPNPHPPSNPYANPVQAPQQPQPAAPVNPYAPVPGSNNRSSTPSSGTGQYTPDRNIGAPPMGGPPQPQAAAPPPPPPAAGINAVPPPPPSAASQATPPPPEPEQPQEPKKPKHPHGDRSHIPDDAKPIFEVLNGELQRVKPNIPESFSKKVKDTERRLNILFDHLNNEELQEDTVSSMVTLSQSLAARDFDGAQQLHLELLTTKPEECGQWMVGVKRLIEIARVVV